ncbi:asparagine synthetase B family protein [Amycolatopsis pigmentata]|uniref:asparagine synthase (glutamine-hydrolyzing) n=1 Tax=Amycolatopsis pigmentata TaxID=450801 RepID=A0ABW5G2G1_9PSEU
MAGIAGWIDRADDLTRQAVTVARMDAGLVTRGGKGGLWVSPVAALIQRIDATWGGSGGPAVHTVDGEARVVALCDGYPGEDTSTTPAEQILAAYLRWGPDLAAHLDGVAAFAIWDVAAGELLLGRDRIGLRPLTYLPTPNGLLFASDVTVLARHPKVPAVLDQEAVCALITQSRPPGEGVLAGMREVPPSCVLRADRHGITIRPYWRLEARPHELDLPRTLDRARDLLCDAIHLVTSGVDPGVMLSGGLDSSVLTGLCSTVTGHPPRTFTVAYAGSGKGPDQSYAAEMARFAGCAHTEVTVDAAELSDPATLAAVVAAKDYPSPYGDKNVSPYLFFRRMAEHTPLVLSGESADVMFGGATGPQSDGRPLTTFPWLERFRQVGKTYGLGTGLFDQDLLRTLDAGAYLDRMFVIALDEVPVLDGEDPVDRVARQVDWINVTRLLELAAGHCEQLSNAVGLQIRFPFADYRLWSFMYNVPTALKFDGGTEKALLRTIGAPVVPDSIMARRKVPYPITYDARYKAALLDRLRELVEDSYAPSRQLIDLEACKRYLTEPALIDRGGWHGRADLEMVLQVDTWMRRLDVGLRI